MLIEIEIIIVIEIVIEIEIVQSEPANWTGGHLSGHSTSP
jgi:hypothetical protein